jgi:hypothetical protein
MARELRLLIRIPILCISSPKDIKMELPVAVLQMVKRGLPFIERFANNEEEYINSTPSMFSLWQTDPAFQY